MDSSLIERLLHSEEDQSIDFKRDQYVFAGASDYVKSELLKDILAFANTERSSPAYILIGVQAVQGRRNRLVGVSAHLEDAHLQQFVNSKTQRPVDFIYRAVYHNLLDIAIIVIPVQQRPVYVNSKYGKVDPGTVYVRRGSSTAVATPDEIAIMGRDLPQEVLSRPLLLSLSRKSLELNRPPGDPEEWVPRALDKELSDGQLRDVTFLVAHSGAGKTVACYKHLRSHVHDGGLGFIVHHKSVLAGLTIDRAIAATLRQLYPRLPPIHPSPLSFCSPEKPLLIVVEDVNRSGDGGRLVEILSSWSSTWSSNDTGDAPSSWRVLCAVWPQTIDSIRDDARRRIAPLLVTTGGFVGTEGRNAVLARARAHNLTVSSSSAKAISTALGHDPLLIALHDLLSTPDPHRTLDHFVERSLSRMSAKGEYVPTAAHREALILLGQAMIAQRELEPSWHSIAAWQTLAGTTLTLLNHLAHVGELIRAEGTSESQRIAFRHDRVRDWFLTEAVAELLHQNTLTDDLLQDPYYAEIIGSVIVRTSAGHSFIQRVASWNPLALFCALRLLGTSSDAKPTDILHAIDRWLAEPTTHSSGNQYLRSEALRILAETDWPEVPQLVRRLRSGEFSGLLARLRNGDLSGGIQFCCWVHPGTTDLQRDLIIDHAKTHHGAKLAEELGAILKSPHLPPTWRIGALRIAGHFACPDLAEALDTCWNTDIEREQHLDEYLWAFAQCCSTDSDRYLEPVCDAWARLPDERIEQTESPPREAVASRELQLAFRLVPPVYAIRYFVSRASSESLRWPITLILHEIDHPNAVSFTVRELAAHCQRHETVTPFAMSVADHWRRSQREMGCPMSVECRSLLLDLWRDSANEIHLCIQAFALWEATQYPSDIDVLREADPPGELAQSILKARLDRGDSAAIPQVLDRQTTDEHGHWLWFSRGIWSRELTEALDDLLGRRGLRSIGCWGETLESDRLTHELLMSLSPEESERLLTKHWEHLRFGPCFVQTAIYVSTPLLVKAARAAVDDCPKPSVLMDKLGLNWGLSFADREGLTRESQVFALAPYIHLLSEIDILSLWHACNDRGWHGTRRLLLDDRLYCLKPEERRSSDQIRDRLDDMIASKQAIWISLWIDDLIKSGKSWQEVLETMVDWMQSAGSVKALRIVAAAIRHRGSRADLVVFEHYEGDPRVAASQVIKDTNFAVRRRSLI